MTNATLDQLTARGAVQAADLVPILPVAGTVLQSATAASLRTYVLAGAGAQTGLVVITPSGDATGAADTAAIQAALNTGANVYLSPGLYYTNATLNITTTAQHGQRLYGAGATSSTGLGSGTTIRPTAAVTTAILIDGTGFGGYLQSFAVDDLTLDMTNMTDVATNAAIKQVQAFDGRYSRVRIINSGTNKRAWLFNAGAYTTTLHDCVGQFVEATGISTANGVTTLTFINFDGNQLYLTYAVNIRVYGGAFQGTGTTKFRLRFAAAIHLETDVEGTGVFLDVDASVNALWSRCELQGFSGTYMTGAPGPSGMLLDQQVNYNTYPFSLNVGSFKFNNQGVAGSSTILSGGAGASYYLTVGRTGIDAFMGVAAAPNDWVGGTVAGDAVIASWGASSTLFLAGNQIPNAKVNAAGFHTLGAGVLKQGAVIIQPTADTDVLTVRNAAGTIVFDIATNASAGNNLLHAVNGANLIGWSDGFVTQTFNIDAGSGSFQSQAHGITPRTDGVIFNLRNAASTALLLATSNATASLSTISMNNGAVLSGYSDNAATLKWSLNSATGVFKQATTVVASLTAPATVGAGAHHFVTDANATMAAGIGAVVAGGGANFVPVYSDGTNWRIG